MKTLIGRKIGMTQMFTAKGKVEAVTLVEAGPCQVTQVKTDKKDGYFALQMGFGEKKKAKKSEASRLKGKVPKTLKEVRGVSGENELKVGDTISVDIFKEGDEVKVMGLSKGKGFAGVIKRHNFHRGPESHGSHHHREPGSIGAMFPQHVTKGTKLPGRMGHARVTVKNLKILSIDKEKNILAISGAIPGANKEIVVISG